MTQKTCLAVLTFATVFLNVEQLKAEQLVCPDNSTGTSTISKTIEVGAGFPSVNLKVPEKFVSRDDELTDRKVLHKFEVTVDAETFQPKPAGTKVNNTDGKETSVTIGFEKVGSQDVVPETINTIALFEQLLAITGTSKLEELPNGFLKYPPDNNNDKKKSYIKFDGSKVTDLVLCPVIKPSVPVCGLFFRSKNFPVLTIQFSLSKLDEFEVLANKSKSLMSCFIEN